MQLPAAAAAPGVEAGATAPPTVRRCPKCAEVIQPEAVKCPHCQQFLDGRRSEPERNGPDWERRSELGFWPALFATIKGVLFAPAETFEKTKLDGPWSALGFCMCTAAIGVSGAVVWEVLKLAALGGSSGAMLSAGIFMGAIGAVLILVPLSMAILAGVVHLMLLILGAAKEPFSATLRATAYSFGGSYVFVAIPACGSLINTIWGTVSCIHAVAKMHRITYGRAAAAVLIPFGVFFVICVAIGVAIAISQRA